jgi:single-strand DNA-binding protein
MILFDKEVFMAGSLNKVTLIGNLGKDPEIRSTNDGKEIASFTIATSDAWKDKATGEKREKTEWHRIVVFNEGLVGVIKNYLQKGSKVFIEGSLQTRKWTDPQGLEKYTTEVVLQNYNATLILLDSRDGAGASRAQSEGVSGAKENQLEHSEIDDEIPF